MLNAIPGGWDAGLEIVGPYGFEVMLSARSPRFSHVDEKSEKEGEDADRSRHDEYQRSLRVRCCSCQTRRRVSQVFQTLAKGVDVERPNTDCIDRVRPQRSQGDFRFVPHFLLVARHIAVLDSVSSRVTMEF